MATHAAMVDRVDQNIGKLLVKLEEIQELDNTLVFFMSDNRAQPQPDPITWLCQGKNFRLQPAHWQHGKVHFS